MKWFGHLERGVYNTYVLVASISIFAALLILIRPYFLRHPKRKGIIGLLALNLLFAILTIELLFVIKIEIVHFFQYTGFAILCFPLVGNFTRTLVWTTLAGAADEAYQYFYLAPDRTLYYDFNDVIANLIGGAFGICLMFILGARDKVPPRTFFRSPLFFSLMAVALLVIALFLTGILGIYPESPAEYSMVKVRPEGFWSVVHPNVTYHVVQPFEGFLIIITLIALYNLIYNHLREKS